MRQNKEHKLVPEDAELFNAMRGNYFSNNERVFFERLQDKEEHEFTVSNYCCPIKPKDRQYEGT